MKCGCVSCRLADFCIDCGQEIEPTRFYLGSLGPLCSGCRDRRVYDGTIGHVQEAEALIEATPDGQTQSSFEWTR